MRRGPGWPIGVALVNVLGCELPSQRSHAFAQQRLAKWCAGMGRYAGREFEDYVRELAAVPVGADGRLGQP